MTIIVMTVFMLSFQAAPQLWAESSPSPTVQAPPNMNNQPTLSGNQPPQTGSGAPPPIGSLPSVDQFQAGEEGTLQAVSAAEAVVNTTASNPDANPNLDDLYNAMMAAIAEADAAEKAFSDATAASDAAQAAVLSSQQAVDVARAALASAQSDYDAAWAAYTPIADKFREIRDYIMETDAEVLARQDDLAAASKASFEAGQATERAHDTMNAIREILIGTEQATAAAQAALDALDPETTPPEELAQAQRNLDEAKENERETRIAYNLAEADYKFQRNLAEEIDRLASIAYKAYDDAISAAFNAREDFAKIYALYLAAGSRVDVAFGAREDAQSELDQDLIDLNYTQNEADRLREEAHAAYEAWNDASQRAVDAIKAYNDALAASNP